MPGIRQAPAPLATIDMGSNSYHLLVSQYCDGELQVLSTLTRRAQTALLMKGDQLTDKAVEQACDVLREFRQLADYFACEPVLAVTTSALRQAVNPEHLLDPAADILGAGVKVIDGQEEARLIYRGVCADPRMPGGANLVIDIGGGSTELIQGDSDSVLQLASLQLGCVSSLQRWFSDGRLSASNFQACNDHARQVLAADAPSFSAAGRVVVACSGTAQAVSQVLGHEVVHYQALHQLRDRLLAQFSELAAVDIAGLDNNRARLLMPGLAILCAIMEATGAEQLLVIDSALREGLAWEHYRPQVGREPGRRVAL